MGSVLCEQLVPESLGRRIESDFLSMMQNMRLMQTNRLIGHSHHLQPPRGYEGDNQVANIVQAIDTDLVRMGEIPSCNGGEVVASPCPTCP
jgi:hypothetical protein